MKRESLKILYASYEAFPFAASGDAGEIAGSLPQQIKLLGADIRVVLPFYATIPVSYTHLANGIVSGSEDDTANSNADDTAFSDGDGDGTANGSADATSDCDGNGAADGNSGGIANGSLNGDSDGASDTAETVPPDTDAVSKLPQTDGSSEISDTNPVISDTPHETSGTLNSEEMCIRDSFYT